MNLLRSLFTTGRNFDSLFEQKGKTLAEYQQELLSKMAKRQFEKLQSLGLNVPVSVA